MTTKLSVSLLQTVEKVIAEMPENVASLQLPGQPFLVSKNLLADAAGKYLLQAITVGEKEFYIYQLME
jgi:hypothetical protein